jgi:hypothetical protein
VNDTPELALSDLTLTAIQAEATRAHRLHVAYSRMSPRRALELLGGRGDVLEGSREQLVTELIRVAAAAASWAEALERGRASNGAPLFDRDEL